MPFVDKAWRANVNVWKRHLTLQLVFNHGECMMHANKNANRHVVDQNVDQISGEIAYVPLGEKIKSKRSSYMHPFFFFFFGGGGGNEYKTCLPVVTTKWGFQSWSWILDLLSRGPMDLKFGRASQKSDGIGFWTCFPEVWWFEVWMCFLEVRWNWILDVLPRVFMDLNLDVLHRGPLKLNFGRAFQRSDGFKIWTCFPEVWWFEV